MINKLSQPFVARLVRIHPTVRTTYGYLRLELYGCPGIEVLERLLLWPCRQIFLSMTRSFGVRLRKDNWKSEKQGRNPLPASFFNPGRPAFAFVPTSRLPGTCHSLCVLKPRGYSVNPLDVAI